MIKLMLFVSAHCPHCPRAAAVASRVSPEYEGLSYEKIRMKTEKGKWLSAKFGINVFPTMLMFNEEGKLKYKISGVPSEDALREKIERLLGLRKSLLSRLFK